jgi:hypothetical protein
MYFGIACDRSLEKRLDDSGLFLCRWDPEITIK